MRRPAFWITLAAASFSSSLVLAQAATPVPLTQHTEAVVAPPPVQDQLVVNVAAGATLNAGNTESYAGNLGGRLGLIRYPSQLTIEALGTLGYAKNATTGDVEKTSANVIGRGRYDLFLSRMDALFVALQPRSDEFAGIDVRLQNQVGYLRNLYFPADTHRLWTELGYDLTYDNFSVITVTTAEDVTGQVTDSDPRPGATYTRTTTATTRPDDDIVHSGRLFFGYLNQNYPAANLNLGVETLFDVEDSKNVRVNGLGEITSSVSKAFKLGIQSRVFFDNVPVPGKKKTDAIIAVQLVYTFDSLADVVVAPCPACDCSAQVAEAKAACEARSLGAASEKSAVSPADVPQPAVEPSAPATSPAPAP